MALRPVKSYNIPITGASTPGPPVSAGIRALRLNATAEAYISIGVNPVATVAAGMRVGPGVAGENIGIAQGEQIAVISTATGGVLNVSEMTA